MLCTKLGEIGSVILEKKKKIWKVYDNDAAADDGQQLWWEKLTWASAQVS